MVQPASNTFGPVPAAAESSEGQERADDKAYAKATNAKANEEVIEKNDEEASETVDTDEADSLELDSLSSQSAYAPSSSEEYTSDSMVEADGDELSDYEAYFEWDYENSERGIWTCECGEAFVDGKCPYGHCGFCKTCGWTIVGDCSNCPKTCQGCGADKVSGVCAECDTKNSKKDESTVKKDIIVFSFCKSCGWNIVGDCLRCPKTCQGCGKDKVNGVCAECDPKKEDIKARRDIIIFDDKDGVWRCGECQWEIEADNETVGNCHCENEEGGMRMIDLSQIPEYERADDAASSTEFSSDEEEDSEDEYAIDDGEDVMEAERFGQRVDSDEDEEAAPGGGFLDSNTTLDGHNLAFQISPGTDNPMTPNLKFVNKNNKWFPLPSSASSTQH